TMGWNFYQSANSAYWSYIFAVPNAPAPPVPIWPYPVMFAGFLVSNHLFQALLIIVMGLWFFGWAGTLFLSSTRVIFAAAFDRVLPAWAANISAKRPGPTGAHPLGQAARPLRLARLDDRAVDRGQRDLRLQADLHERVP